MVKKSAVLLAIMLGFSLILRFPGLSSENSPRIGGLAGAASPFAQTQLKNPLAGSERFRQNRHFFSDSPDDLHWICAYGTEQSDFLYTIQQTREGGYIATGMSYGTDNRGSDAVLIKINAEGVLEWQKSYGRERYDAYYHCSVVETPDGGYLLATDSINPDTSSFSDSDILVLKLSSDGSILWQKAYGGEDTYEYSRGSIQQTRDGGYILAGTTYHRETYLYSILILKIDATGNLLWDKRFKTLGVQWGDAVQQTPDGGYIVGCEARGYPQISSQDAHPLLLKLDSNGNIEWQKLYEGAGKRYALRTNIITTQDNGYIVADAVDTSIRTIYGEEHNGDIWVFKLDSVGNILWQNLYGGSEWDFPYALYEARNEGYVVGGYTASYGGEKGWILKLDPAGNVAWQKAYGKENTPNLLFSLSQNSNGDFLAAGYVVYHGYSDMMALNISEKGEIGAGYGWVTDTDTIPTPTFTVPIYTDLISITAGLVSKFSNASSADFNLSRELLCWNLNQPPINVSLRTETNRSLYRKELYNFLSWEPNPQNEEFNIIQYKIYVKRLGKQYELLKTVPANTFEYLDLILRTGELFEYAITSVDSEGRESPRSASVSIS